MVKAAASKGDVEELYRRHARELHSYLYRRAGQAGTDLLGEVFVIALQRLGDLPEPDLRRAWLFGTARRLLLATQRSSRKRHAAETECARLDGPAADQHQVDGSNRIRAVREALASLSEQDRELVRLIEWENLGITEAAMVLGIRPGTARVRLHRARRALAAHPALQGLLATSPDPKKRPSTLSGKFGPASPASKSTAAD